jgi:hypothetical protein
MAESGSNLFCVSADPSLPAGIGRSEHGVDFGVPPRMSYTPSEERSPPPLKEEPRGQAATPRRGGGPALESQA